MEKMHIEGIAIEPQVNVERESKSLEVRNKLQVRLAEKLGFLKTEDDPMFLEFIDIYSAPIGNMLHDHPKLLDSYETYLEEGSEKEFDFTEIQNLLPQYLPKLH